MKNNKLIKEELHRILEIMHGEDFMPKGIILESGGKAGQAFMKLFMKRVTGKTGYGLLGDAQVNKWFDNLVSDLNKDFPNLRFNTKTGDYDQVSWDDALE